MLQIFWSPSAPAPSTVILLNSAVILPKDDPDSTKWNCHRFEIHHVKKPVDNSFNQITRIFSCPEDGRDAWVFAMNESLLEYEKAKADSSSSSSSSASSRKSNDSSSSSPQRFVSTLAPMDDYPKVSKAKRSIPIPKSPTSTVKRSVPRPQSPLDGIPLVVD